MFKRLLIFQWIIYCFILNIQAQQLKVGAAYRVITPDPLLPVSGGVGIPKPAKEKKGELYVRAMVFEKGETVFAIAVVDNLGWPATLGDKSRALVKGIAPEHIMIGATHTHSGPDAYAFPDETGKSIADLEYLDWCVEQIADAINEAKDNAKSASLKIAEGEAKGQIAYNYYAPQLYDPRCNVIQAIGEDGQIIATLVNYAIHPEVIGANRGIVSPDVCGPLYERIEEKTGGMAFFVNGALGGMITADNRREGAKEVATYEECQRIGYLLADEALRIVKDAPVQEDPILESKSKRITFPVESPLMKFIMEYSPLGHKNQGTDSISTQLNLLNIGTAQALTIPGEALPNIGYYLKRNMKGEQNFLLGQMNDGFGYMLTKEDFNSFKRYSYITETSLGEMTGEILIEESLKFVAEDERASDHVGVGAKPAKGAKVYFDGSRKMLDENWTYWDGPRLGAKLPIKWKIVDDPVDGGTAMNTNDPAAAGGKYGAADIVTKEKFRDFRLHVEFLIANQGGNSGVYLQNRYEIQVLDGDSTDHGMAAVINEKAAPYHPYNGLGKWNAYDITFRAARFNEKGKLLEKAHVTVYFNGIKIHENQPIQKVWGGPNSGIDGGNDQGKGITDVPGGLKLQAEGHNVLYRNIWIKKLNLERADTDF